MHTTAQAHRRFLPGPQDQYLALRRLPMRSPLKFKQILGATERGSFIQSRQRRQMPKPQTTNFVQGTTSPRVRAMSNDDGLADAPQALTESLPGLDGTPVRCQ
jgi:hypothetical protein